MGHRDFREEADELRSHREFAGAGDKYTLAAYGNLEESGLTSGYNPEFSEGLYLLLNSALCYRLGGELERCRNRCNVGILIAEDAKEFVFKKHGAEKGLYNEYIGDFRLIGDMDGYDEAYGEAREFYEGVEAPPSRGRLRGRSRSTSSSSRAWPTPLGTRSRITRRSILSRWSLG